MCVFTDHHCFIEGVSDACGISSPDSHLFVRAEFIKGRVYGVDPFSVIGSEKVDGPAKTGVQRYPLFLNK
ncbi:hypothetical protein [Candidatus Pelagisphaera phototrophica]|uniref:hypothetical protein n=1 Tax=Candidatus Pelagisphaera phototrophica TaxID=2684113 RepID=UPI0019DE217F|nr:hypothetical protein [Candidatus Pelagisphaera phototrophica]QXD31751.1 hypothetical protein GA004_15755 [Candidatus Pelagisphaera phototrophica]